MRKTAIASLVVMTALSVVGCASFMSIPDDHQLVSNHRMDETSGNQRSCDFNTRLAAGNSQGHSGLNPEAIRLLNWNVYKGTSADWAEDFSRLSRDSDIVALQEAQLHPDFKDGLDQSRMNWDLTTAFTYGNAETGVLLASKVKPGVICALHAEEPLITIPKSALVTEYRIKGSEETLMVANIHMINFSFGTVEYSQQMSALKRVLQQHRGALIVTGDFNTWSDKRMSILAAMTKELELTAVTYPNDFRMSLFGNPLDHVYFRGLETSSVAMEQVESSDHNPMMVTFRLASQ